MFTCLFVGYDLRERKGFSRDGRNICLFLSVYQSVCGQEMEGDGGGRGEGSQ